MPAATETDDRPFRCPICRRAVQIPADPAAAKSFFPFCSDRCKLIDLGRWLDGNYQIPVEITPDQDDD
jgi:endogenous inhibitor of DNA gyrase (YacG/DUF329 family)